MSHYGFRLLNEDMMHNPLRGLPRNMVCPCHSGEKFKKCCLPLTKKYIPKAFLKEYESARDMAITGKKVW